MALLIAIVAAGFWPGLAMYDTVVQYGQVIGGQVDDWHPPIMVRLWQLLHPLAAGTAPMFVVQAALYATGFALIVSALVRSGRVVAGFAVAALALSPLLLGWQMVVLKDTQMLGALLCAVGIVANFRLIGRELPVPALGAILILLLYATLARTNAVFAVVPLAVLISNKPRSIGGRSALALVAILAAITLTPLINHRLLDAMPSKISNTLPVYDLAAIAVATDGSAPFTASDRAQIRSRYCAKPFFWDPLGDPTACGSVTARLMEQPASGLYRNLGNAIIRHPLAYAEHRLAHWNSTERWLVAPGLREAGPPDEAERNDLGLSTPRGLFVRPWQAAAAVEAGTPLGWPIIWTVIALLLLPVAWRQRERPIGNLALALAASAIVLEASFLVISIASDLRYHLWSMTAAALALILLGGELQRYRRYALAGGAVMALVIAAGLWSRAALPQAPASYQAMIHAPTG